MGRRDAATTHNRTYEWTHPVSRVIQSLLDAGLELTSFRAHDFTIAVEAESDNQLDEKTFSLAIYPNDWLGRGADPFFKKRDLDYEALRWYR